MRRQKTRRGKLAPFIIVSAVAAGAVPIAIGQMKKTGYRLSRYHQLMVEQEAGDMVYVLFKGSDQALADIGVLPLDRLEGELKLRGLEGAVEAQEVRDALCLHEGDKLGFYPLAKIEEGYRVASDGKTFPLELVAGVITVLANEARPVGEIYERDDLQIMTADGRAIISLDLPMALEDQPQSRPLLDAAGQLGQKLKEEFAPVMELPPRTLWLWQGTMMAATAAVVGLGVALMKRR